MINRQCVRNSGLQLKIKICLTLKVFQNITAGSNNITNVTLTISYIRNVRERIITIETLYCILINTHILCLHFLRTMVLCLYVAAVIAEKFSVAVDFSTHALSLTCYSLQLHFHFYTRTSRLYSSSRPHSISK